MKKLGFVMVFVALVTMGCASAEPTTATHEHANKLHGQLEKEEAKMKEMPH